MSTQKTPPAWQTSVTQYGLSLRLEVTQVRDYLKRQDMPKLVSSRFTDGWVVRLRTEVVENDRCISVWIQRAPPADEPGKLTGAWVSVVARSLTDAVTYFEGHAIFTLFTLDPDYEGHRWENIISYKKNWKQDRVLRTENAFVLDVEIKLSAVPAITSRPVLNILYDQMNDIRGSRYRFMTFSKRSILDGLGWLSNQSCIFATSDILTVNGINMRNLSSARLVEWDGFDAEKEDDLEDCTSDTEADLDYLPTYSEDTSNATESQHMNTASDSEDTGVAEEMDDYGSDEQDELISHAEVEALMEEARRWIRGNELSGDGMGQKGMDVDSGDAHDKQVDGSNESTTDDNEETVDEESEEFEEDGDTSDDDESEEQVYHDGNMSSRDHNDNTSLDTWVITGVASPTWIALIFYLHTGIIDFAPLSSSSKRLRQKHISVYKKRYPKRVPPCSAKSMYRLATKLKHKDLKYRAFEHLKQQLSHVNVLAEIFSQFTSQYEEIRDIELELLEKH
ncbi:hypothetical protein CERSUDRAFT_96833 [Gelatoporia subvermispora B]|uniref:BTB domain-containing protein n=1 Tax=Ceriporiopsis subvermispora (strain B) TaxID=914234 RepID=M2R8C5_CERS8|nr:hypothetical protein CERSUDRAFT_96833 [Gelatoporia subvermispora B]